MENKYLDKVLPFLQKISKERREKFYTYFQNAPLWLLDSFQVENMLKETTLSGLGTRWIQFILLAAALSRAQITES